MSSIEAMKWFWISLIGFCVLMCSCASKKVSTDVHTRHNVQSEVSVLTESIKIDTTETRYSEQVNEHLVIKETIITKEYDKDTGNLTKETTTKRELAQGIQTDIEEESLGKVTEIRTDSLGKVENVEIQTEINEDSVIESDTSSFWEKFGKYFGVTLGCVIGLLLLYLLLKNRVN